MTADFIQNSRGTVIRVGQVWADNDPRCKGRTLAVVAIERGFKRRVLCEVVTDRGGEPVSRPRDARISPDRFHPTSTGYRLVSDPEETQR